MWGNYCIAAVIYPTSKSGNMPIHFHWLSADIIQLSSKVINLSIILIMSTVKRVHVSIMDQDITDDRICGESCVVSVTHV